jgi:hypothetical protein
LLNDSIKQKYIKCLKEMENSLALTEKIYLLAIRPEKGGIRMSSSNAIRYVLAGAIIFEMVTMQNIRIENKSIHLTNSSSKDPLHLFALEKLFKYKNQMKISVWITKFAYSAATVRKNIQNSLVRKRLLRMEEKRFLFFRWKKPVLIKRQVVYKLQDEIRKSVSRGTLNEEQIMLLSLLQPAGLMRSIFPERNKRIAAKNELKKLTADSQVSNSVSVCHCCRQCCSCCCFRCRNFGCSGPWEVNKDY